MRAASLQAAPCRVAVYAVATAAIRLTTRRRLHRRHFTPVKRMLLPKTPGFSIGASPRPCYTGGGWQNPHPPSTNAGPVTSAARSRSNAAAKGRAVMAESVSARSKAGATQRAPAAPRKEYAKAPSLSVRYWKRMRVNKVYPVVVSWRGASRDGDVEGGPVTVRLLMAGAQVVPSEHTMDPREPRDTATFYVTPLAKGGLRGEKIEVLQGGRKIQEIRLPSKTTSQSSTLVWLFLAIFLPWLIWH